VVEGGQRKFHTLVLHTTARTSRRPFDLACSIERLQLLGGEHEIHTAEIVQELRYLPCSNDGDDWHRLMAQQRTVFRVRRRAYI